MSHEVTFNDVRERYEITVDGDVAGFADAKVSKDGIRLFDHTVVKPEFRGQGLAGELVGKALDDVREQGQKVVAACWYVADFIEAHPDYADLRA